jgi:hypothetical protein
VVRAGAERDQFFTRPEPVSREANDVAVIGLVASTFIDVRIFRFHRFFADTRLLSATMTSGGGGSIPIEIGSSLSQLD